MLRSFDYAPRVAEMTAAATVDDNGTEQRAYRAAEWSARNQAAFLEAYAGRELTGDEQTLLAAYVADKAVYECVYEARNRPDVAVDPAGRARATRVLSRERPTDDPAETRSTSQVSHRRDRPAGPR